MNSTIFEGLLDSTFHWFSHNSTYVIPGMYDITLADVSWVLAGTMLFFTMQTGFAMIEAGIVHPKNAVNVMMKNIVDVCFGGTLYWFIGYGLMYGRGEYTNPFFGFGDFLVNPDIRDPLMGQIIAFLFFEISFMSTIVSAASGAVAERIRFVSYIIYSTLLVFTYSICGGWLWGQHGFLKNLGAIDFAGAAPMHLPGGVAALISAIYIGPRIGRFDKGTKPIPLGNPVYVLEGCFLVWWGWVAFNAGSSYGVTGGKWELAARAGVGTALASMAAGFVSIFYSMILHKGRIDVLSVVSAIVSGLVAINSGCFLFPAWASAVTGGVAGFLALSVAPIIDKLRIDDACGSVAIHMTGGLWGHLSVGLFADPLVGRKGWLMGGDYYQFAIQCFSALCIATFSAIMTVIILWIIDRTVTLRMTPEEEIQGSDLLDHYIGDGTEIDKAYPPMEKIYTITTPVALTRRIRSPSMPTIQRFENQREHFGVRKLNKGHTNLAFDRTDI